MSIRKSAGRVASAFQAVGRAFSERREVLKKIALRAGAAVSLVFIVLLVHRSAYALVMKSPDFKVPQVAARATVAPPWADPTAAESVVMLPAGRDNSRWIPTSCGASPPPSPQPWVRRVVPSSARSRPGPA
jgi:hypothetical protein